MQADRPLEAPGGGARGGEREVGGHRAGCPAWKGGLGRPNAGFLDVEMRDVPAQVGVPGSGKAGWAAGGAAASRGKARWARRRGGLRAREGGLGWTEVRFRRREGGDVDCRPGSWWNGAFLLRRLTRVGRTDRHQEGVSDE